MPASFVAFLLAGSMAGVANAQTIQVTSGYLDVTGTSGPIVVGGDRGFSMASRVSVFAGVYGPANCNADPIHCVPDATVSLQAAWSDLDLSLTNRPVTLDGITYWDVNCGCPSPDGLNVQFNGSATLPPIAPSATVTAPFTFTGPFVHQVPGSSTAARETMIGTGTATLYLSADRFFPGSWHIDRVLYVLGTTLPFPWRSADVGIVGQAGTASVSDGTFTAAGAGRDIWGDVDSFDFTSQPLAGDGDAIARVTAEQNTNPYAKAGVMIRASYDASAPFVLVDVKPDGGIELLSRAAPGGSTAYLGGADSVFPVWLKLTRSGATITASMSADGSSWSVVGAATLSGAAYAGLAVTSHDSTTLNEAAFDSVSVTTAGALPPSWSQIDVGQVGTTGFASYDAGVFTVGGAGADVWGTADAFRYVYQYAVQEMEITARVRSEQDTNPYAKAGVMIRQNLASDAANAILDVKPDGEVEFMARSAAGSPTEFIAAAAVSLPAWIRLTRSGTSVTAAISSDGANWTTVATATLAPFDGAYAGLAVTSHDPTLLNTGVFDNVSVGMPPAAPVSDHTAIAGKP